VTSASFSPDGDRVVTVSLDRTAGVWDARTGSQIFQLLHSDVVLSAAFSPDGTKCATTAADGLARIWDLRCGRALPLLLNRGENILGFDLSKDGKRLATIGDSTVKVADLETGAERVSLFENIAQSTTSDPKFYRVQFNPANEEDAQVRVLTEQYYRCGF
jgi:WD40 repeat protein